MPVCVACGTWGIGPLCRDCRRGCYNGGTSHVHGFEVRYGLAHRATGRQLVHRLKYESLVAAADLLADFMVLLMPSDAACVAPVPRASFRRLVSGIDSAFELAERVADKAGLPLVNPLAARWWWPRHSRATGPRSTPRFVLRESVPAGLVLVDDVVTTGTTARAAVAACQGRALCVLAATSPGRIMGRDADDLRRRDTVAEETERLSPTVRPSLRFEGHGDFPR